MLGGLYNGYVELRDKLVGDDATCRVVGHTMLVIAGNIVTARNPSHRSPDTVQHLPFATHRSLQHA